MTCSYTSCSIGGGIALASSLPEVLLAAGAASAIETAGKVVVKVDTLSTSAAASATAAVGSFELGIVHSALHILNEKTEMDYDMLALCTFRMEVNARRHCVGCSLAKHLLPVFLSCNINGC